jgi:SAM-dependent methyltransferase
MDLDVWACPDCFSELSEHGSEIACAAEARSFRRMDGLPVLVRSEQEFLLREAERYASAWKKTKWAVRRDAVLDLPYINRPGWKLKALSLRELLAILGPPRKRRVVDVGAGTGWLSYRLEQEGFRCFATDISSDSDVGLGAATKFDDTPNGFERAIAALDRWPFRSGTVDIAICNASLQYLADARVAIEEAARVLRSGGGVCDNE